MGRTRRKKRHRHLGSKNTSLDHDEAIINLRKWLNENSFFDSTHLQLRNFTVTGRGVTSKKSIKENDVLIKMPLDLLITFDIVEKSGLLRCLDNIKAHNTQTIIALYLALEKHKGQYSQWKNYINTLPYPEPTLPWMCKFEELDVFPEDLQVAARKLQNTYADCFSLLQKSILPAALCDCCKIPIIRVLEANLFKWAYVLVNTRAVYIDPINIISKNSLNISILSDKPSMALCPFLDMFNHSHLADTKVKVINIQGQCFYELSTVTSFKKYEQIFISYGSHDNEKLLMEYGFFIRENILDCVRFGFNEIQDVLKLAFDERQYKFIKSHQFNSSDIYIGVHEAASFNLKAILFIAFNPTILQYNSVIFSNTYPDDFDGVIRNCAKVLLNYKLKVYQGDFDKLNCCSLEVSEHVNLVKDFLEYRINYVQILIKNL